MNSCELTVLITAVANSLSCHFTPNELSLLGSVLLQLGDTLTTIALHKSICSEKDENKTASQ